MKIRRTEKAPGVLDSISVCFRIDECVIAIVGKLTALLTILLFSLFMMCTASRAQCLLYQECGGANWVGDISTQDGRLETATTGSAILRTSDGGLHWVTVRTGEYYGGVSQVDTNTVFVAGNSGNRGSVIYTLDGGSTWSVIKLTGYSEQLGAISASDANNVTVVGSNSEIFRTTDGGTTWHAQYSGVYLYYNAVSFPDSSNGSVVGYSYPDRTRMILQTTDAGASWAVRYNTHGGYLSGLCFPDAKNGFAVGDSGIVLRTIDGGNSWVPSSIAPEPVTLRDVSFSDSMHGAAVGFDLGNHDGVICLTEDGGDSWSTMKVPEMPFVSVAFTDSETFTVSTSYGSILRWDSGCDSTISVTLVAPPNGEARVPLVPIDTIQNTVTLSWDFSPHTVAANASLVQVSRDSMFPSTDLVQRYVPIGGSKLITYVVIPRLQGGTRYFWRVTMLHSDGTQTGWSAIARFTTTSGVIRGRAFDDLNHDTTWNAGEPFLPERPVQFSGKIITTVITDPQGSFAVTGLDSGLYVISEQVRLGASRTLPASGIYVVNLGVDDTSARLDFGEYFPWNSISGTVYFDANENGSLDGNESTLPAWPVYLKGSEANSYQVLTDSSGKYVFPRLYLGDNEVILDGFYSWEQITPPLQQGYLFNFDDYDHHVVGANFGVHHIPRRVKSALSVHDSSQSARRDIWWGVRPGATLGIWGVDSTSTTADYSEGEFELPPVLSGMFDARFVDPHPGPARFGNGSWTDMRPYLSPAQVDTYVVRFSPGLVSGGGYPMTLHWMRDLIGNAYGGSVTLRDQSGSIADMRNADSVVINDPTVTVISLIAEHPLLPPLDVRPSPPGLLSQYRLGQNYPNPFNPSTKISFELARRSEVSLKIFDLLGHEVAALVNGSLEAGTHEVSWDAGKCASGVYFYRIIASPNDRHGEGVFSDVKKLMILR